MLVVIVAASVLIGVSRGQQRPAVNEFADKVVTVYLSDGQQMQGGFVLENVEIREIAGAQFLLASVLIHQKQAIQHKVSR